MMVSFMHLSAYIPDKDIIEKLTTIHVTVLGDIRRRYYPDSNVADGKRLVKVQLPPALKSLPYTMKFGDQYYRVIHNNQVKLCRICNSDEHLMLLQCPQFVRHRCSAQGHLKRNCDASQCRQCLHYGLNCTCTGADDKTAEDDFIENANVVRRFMKCRSFACICGDESDDDWMCDKCGKSDDCECVIDTDDLEDSDVDNREDIAHSTQNSCELSGHVDMGETEQSSSVAVVAPVLIKQVPRAPTLVDSTANLVTMSETERCSSAQPITDAACDAPTGPADRAGLAEPHAHVDSTVDQSSCYPSEQSEMETGSSSGHGQLTYSVCSPNIDDVKTCMVDGCI